MSDEQTRKQRDYWDSRARGDVKGLKSKILARFFRTGFVGVNRLREARMISENLAGTRVLDVGCGDGAFITKLKKKNRQREFSGVDFSPPMVEIAKGRGLDVFVMDMRSLEFEDTSFDSVYAVRSIKNLLEREWQAEAMRELPSSTAGPLIRRSR